MRTIDYDIEALRGFSALTVVCGHIIYAEYTLDPLYHPQNQYLYAAPGHLAVLIFFMLSGYVIGLTTELNFNKEFLIDYLKKRLVRIYPIYILSLIFAFLILEHFNYKLLLDNLFFVSLFTNDVIQSNEPAWSLNYEIYFYLFFILIVYFKPNLVAILLCLLLFSGLQAFNFNIPSLLFAFSIGYLLWVTGLFISKKTQTNENPKNNSGLLSALFLILSFEKLNVWSIFLHEKFQFHIDSSPYKFHTIINISDLFYFPLIVYVILLFSNREKESVFYKLCFWYNYLTPLLYLLLFLYQKRYYETGPVFVPVIFYFISILFLFSDRTNRRIKTNTIFKGLIFTGNISYAVYIFHIPLLLLFKKINFFSGNYFTFSLRAIIYFFLLYVFSYIAERLIQPEVKSLIMKRKKATEYS